MMMYQQPSMQEAKELIEIFISCRSLANMDIFSKSDPYVIFKVLGQQGNNWVEYGRTEVIKDNLNPNFSKSFQYEYIFETQQHIKFEVWDFDSSSHSDFIGEAQTTIGQIAGSRNQLFITDLRNQSKKYGGKIILKIDKVNYCSDTLYLNLMVSNVKDNRWFKKPKPFLKFLRYTADKQYNVIAYQTEIAKYTRNPIFKPFQALIQRLCNGNLDQTIIIELWDGHRNGKHEFLGCTQLTINQLLNEKQKNFQFKKNKSEKVVGVLNANQVQKIERFSFVEYLRGGLQLNLVVAIDFTGSNGIPSKPDSLHYFNQRQLNQYQQAIMSVGEILIQYDHTKQIPVYGFGAKPRLSTLNSNVALHCFPINGLPANPEVNGLPGIMQAYQNILPNIELSGPTYFSPIISETMKISQQFKQAGNQYLILLILTDGAIHDMDSTKDLIVQAAYLPLSIIIVGIGNEDFLNMQILDGDAGLYNKNGEKAKRDLVQFVPYNKFKQNGQLLAREVLAELPDQVEQYHRLIGQKPGQAVITQMDQVQIANTQNAIQQFGQNLIKGKFMEQVLNNPVNMPNQQQFNPQQIYQQQGIDTQQNMNLPNDPLTNPFGNGLQNIQPNQQVQIPQYFPQNMGNQNQFQQYNTVQYPQQQQTPIYQQQLTQYMTNMPGQQSAQGQIPKLQVYPQQTNPKNIQPTSGQQVQQGFNYPEQI